MREHPRGPAKDMMTSDGSTHALAKELLRDENDVERPRRRETIGNRIDIGCLE